MVTMRVAGYTGSIAIVAVLLSACATAKPPEAAPAPAAQSASATAGHTSTEHIYVTEDSLDTACYRETGEISYVEPFALAATDPDHLQMADGLRQAAAEKYPNRVDAIINVHAEDHDVGSEVQVTGEAVQLEPTNKLGCKLPDTIAAAILNLATSSKPRGARRGATTGSGYSGPAGTTNTAVEGSASGDPARDIKQNLRRAMAASMPGRQTQVNEQSLGDQAQVQQAEIDRLRKDLEQMVSGRCAAGDVSAAECDSMRKNAEMLQPHEVVLVTHKDAGDKSPSAFELQNLLQEQRELIEKLRGKIADLSDIPHEAAGAAAPPN
ncbi:MAG TPA: hypothetical protein VGI29_01765 [Candidatus Binataceae bacterium]